MKVLLKRKLYLDGVLYEPNSSGTEVPEFVIEDGVKKKVVFLEKADQKVDRDKEVPLPSDARPWTEENSKRFSPEGPQLVKGHPEIETPLSEIHPDADPVKTAKDLKKAEHDKKEAEKEELLKGPVVGKR